MHFHFMDAGHTGESVPLVVATFSPAGHPLLANFTAIVGAGIFATPADAGLVASLESSLSHIAFLSSHKLRLYISVVTQ